MNQKVGCSVEHALENWNCTRCGRDNRTVVALDGTARCAQCAERTRIQPSRDYLSAFSTLHPELAPVADRAMPARGKPARFGLVSLPPVGVR
jgi:hypothetical protein